MQLLNALPLQNMNIFFFSFEGKMLLSEVEESLQQNGLTLVSVQRSQYKLIEKMRDVFVCKRPLIFADNKYIMSSGTVGVSDEKPNPYWSPECIFVAVKLNL